MPEPELKTYYATVMVTRAEEWCVEAESPEEARELLAAGLGHRYQAGMRREDCYRSHPEELRTSKTSPLRLPKADVERTSCIGCFGPIGDMIPFRHRPSQW
jgi:hypothetical protein